MNIGPTPIEDGLRGGALGIVVPPDLWNNFYIRPELNPESYIPARGLSYFITPMTDALYAGSTTPQEDYEAILAAGDAGYGLEFDVGSGYGFPNERIVTGHGDSYANRITTTIFQVVPVSNLYNGDVGSSPLGNTPGRIIPWSPNFTLWDYWLYIYYKLTWPSDGSVNQRIAQFNIVFVYDDFLYVFTP